MDPENPPRRTKPDQDPLTIDLHATPEPATVSRSNETDDSLAVPSHVASDDAAVSDSGHDAAERERIEEIEARETVEETRAETASAAFTEEPVPSGAGTTYSQTAQPAKPARSGALAAGILGGLIALAGAGVLQYAGIVPSIGPTSSSSGRDLGAEIDALKAQGATPATTDTQGLEQRLATLEQAIGVASDAQGGNSAATENLKAQIDGLNQELATVKSGLADQQRTAQTATSELSTRIEEAEKKLDEPASDVQLARAIAVTALKTAIDRGGPFVAELDALKSISPDDPAIAGLSDLASRGVPSRTELTRTFPDTADAMLAAIRGADPNQGVFSRLIGSAASAVRVRPVGSVEGTGPEAVVARIEDRLTNGDLKSASLEWDGLPQPAKDAGAEFRTKLDERIKAEALIDTAVSGAVTGSAPAKQG